MKKKIHVPQAGLEPATSLVRSDQMKNVKRAAN
jgi:hypothetical protein